MKTADQAKIIQGDILRGYRQSKGLKLRDVAKRSYVSIGHISDVENGRKDASFETLSHLVDALDVPLSDMYMDMAKRLEDRSYGD